MWGIEASRHRQRPVQTHIALAGTRPSKAPAPQLHQNRKTRIPHCSTAGTLTLNLLKEMRRLMRLVLTMVGKPVYQEVGSWDRLLFLTSSTCRFGAVAMSSGMDPAGAQQGVS